MNTIFGVGRFLFILEMISISDSKSLGIKQKIYNSTSITATDQISIFDIEVTSILSFSIFNSHAVLITKIGELFGIGDNTECQISPSLPREKLDCFTRFTIKDEQNRLCIPVAVTCGSYCTLYLVVNPEDKNRNQLMFSASYIHDKEKLPEIIYTRTDSHITTLYGDYEGSYIIYSDGSYSYVSYNLIKTYPFVLDKKFLKTGEIPIRFALHCVNYTLTSKGNVYFYDSYLINDLESIEIVDIVSSINRCFAISNKGKVYVSASNNDEYHGLGKCVKGTFNFTELECLKEYEIVAASTSWFHTLFLTKTGKVLAMGSNKDGELLLESGPSNEPFYFPVETSIKENACEIFTSNYVSAVFCGYTPPNSTNRKMMQDYIIPNY